MRGPPDPELPRVGRAEGLRAPHRGEAAHLPGAHGRRGGGGPGHLCPRLAGPVSPGGAVLGSPRARTGDLLSVSRGVAADHLHDQSSQWIEGFHRQLRQGTKSKALFPTDAALTTMLFLAGQEAQRTWTKRLSNGGEILGQLVIYFEDRLTPYLK